MSDWECIGKIGVDAGLCWIGDPCYFIQNDFFEEDTNKDDRSTVFKSWRKFLDKLNELSGDRNKAPTIASFPYKLGHEGLGVCISTGYGDGTYPVFVRKNQEGRIAEVKVVFTTEDNFEDEIDGRYGEGASEEFFGG